MVRDHVGNPTLSGDGAGIMGGERRRRMGVDDVDRKIAKVRSHLRCDGSADEDEPRLHADDPEAVEALFGGKGRIVARCDDRHLVAARRELPGEGAHVALDAAEMREEPWRDLGNLHPRTSENPASRRDVPAGVGARTEERLLADDRARVDRRIDPDLHVVPHDHAELPEARVDLRPPPYDAVRHLVEAEVRDFRPRPKVAAFPEDAVAHVVLMGDVDAGHQDGVLHFTRVAHLGLRTDGSRRPNVAVRADLGAGPDDRRAFDVGAPPDASARFHEDLTDEGRAAVHIGVVRPLQRREEGRVGTEEVPRPTDVDPFAREPESVDVTLLHQRTNRVRDLVLPSRRLWGLVDEGKDVLVEDVDARVDQVRLRPAGLLLQAGHLAIVHLDDPERLRVGDLREGDHGSADLPVMGDHRGERLARNDHVAVHAEEGAGDVGPHASDRMGGAETLRLFLVGDRETERLAVPEALSDSMALPADEDGHLRDARRTQRLQRVSEKWLAGDRKKGLREIGREGTHPGALSGREDHGLHSVAPFALDRTAEYISFALVASRDSAVRRILGSVPEKRTSDQPSSNWSRHPSTVLTRPPRARRAASSRDSIVLRFDGSYASDPRRTGYRGTSCTIASRGRAASIVTRRAAA